MKALPLAIALSLVCSAASAQTAVSTTTVRVTKDRAVATNSDGNRTTTVRRNNGDGSTTYTTTHTPSPTSASAAPLTMRELNGVWTGREGSARDVAWVASASRISSLIARGYDDTSTPSPAAKAAIQPRDRLIATIFVIPAEAKPNSGNILDRAGGRTRNACRRRTGP